MGGRADSARFLPKAFDTIDHSLPLRKAESVGLDRDSVAWFRSYLLEITQSTALGDPLVLTVIQSPGSGRIY